MELFKQFFIDNWKLILVCFLYLLLLLCSLIKRKNKSNLIDSLFLEVVNLLPGFICSIEMPGNGADKKFAVLNLALNKLGKLLGRKLTSDEEVYFTQKFSDLIEDILCTPQKKGDCNDTK